MVQSEYSSIFSCDMLIKVADTKREGKNQQETIDYRKESLTPMSNDNIRFISSVNYVVILRSTEAEAGDSPPSCLSTQ